MISVNTVGNSCEEFAFEVSTSAEHRLWAYVSTHLQGSGVGMHVFSKVHKPCIYI